MGFETPATNERTAASSEGTTAAESRDGEQSSDASTSQAHDRLRDESGLLRPEPVMAEYQSTVNTTLPVVTIEDDPTVAYVDSPDDASDIGTTAPSPDTGTTAPNPDTDTTAPALPQPPRLDAETVQRYAAEIEAAINRDSSGFLGVGGGDDPDVQKIVDLLDALPEADRRAIEAAYRNVEENDDHKSLREELKDNLDGDDWRKVEAILNRDDSGTNDAGNLMVALSAINDDRGDAERRVLETFATLNSDQMRTMEEKFQRDYGMTIEEALEEFDVSDEAKRAIEFLRVPSNERTAEDIEAFARFAVDEENLDYFAIALRGDTEAARTARERLQADEEFKQKLTDAFKPEDHGGGFLGGVLSAGDSLLGPLDEIVGGVISGDVPSFGEILNETMLGQLFQLIDAKDENVRLVSAFDILNEGQVSLATIASNNSGSLFGFFDNKDNIKLAVENATDKEQQLFARGREIARSGREPANDEERIVLEYYNRLHRAFEEAGSESEAAVWEDQLLNPGGSIITALAEAGEGHERFAALENLSEEDWQRLKDPEQGDQFRSQIEESINDFAGDGEKERLLELLDGKIAADTFEESQSVRRTLTEVIEQNRGGILGQSYDEKNIADAIAALSPEEAQRYQSDSQFRTQVDTFVSEHLNGTEQAYARMLLAQVSEDGQPPEISVREQVLQNVINEVEPTDAINDIETLLQDEQLRQRLATSDDDRLSDEDKALKQAITSFVTAAVLTANPFSGPQTNSLVERYTEQLLTDGRLPVDVKLELGLKNQDFYAQAARVPEEERARLYENLSADEQRLVDVLVSQNGEATLADDIRAFVVGDSGEYQDFHDRLYELTPEQKQQLRDEYATKYGSALDDDFLGKVDEADRNTYRTALTATNVDGRQDFYDNLERALDSKSGISPDGSELTLDRSLQINAAMLTEFQARFEQLPPEKQQQANEYFAQALEQYQNSKEKLAEAFYQAAVLIGGLTVGIATGGAALPALLAFAAVAAAGRIAIKRGIQGNDYDLTFSNILKDGAIGFATGALSVIGPESIAALGGIGRIAAARVTSELAEQGLRTALREGTERALARELDSLVASAVVRGEPITEQALSSIAGRYAANEGSQAAVTAALRTSLESAGREVLPGALERTALSSIISSARQHAAVGVVGGLANVGIETTVGLANGNLEVGNLWKSFALGFGAGVGLSVTFSAAGNTASRLQAHFRQTPDGLQVHARPGTTFEVTDVDGTVRQVTTTADSTVTISGEVQQIRPTGGEYSEASVTPVDESGVPFAADGTTSGDDLVPSASDQRQVDTVPFAVPPDLTPPDLTPAQPDVPASRLPEGVRVEGEGDGFLRRYKVEGHDDIDLVRRGRQQWFYGARKNPVDDTVKLHVTVSDAQDLANVQRILLPALEDPNSSLFRLVGQYKTHDPAWGAGREGPGSPPAPVGNNAKGFTLYPAEGVNPAEIQLEVDRLLSEAGLGLDAPIATGNVDTIGGSTNRVGIVRESWPVGEHADPLRPTGAIIDDQIHNAIRAEFHVQSGQQLTDAQLRQVEQNLGLESGILAYGTDGNLLLLRTSTYSGVKPGTDAFYLDESLAGKGVDVNNHPLSDRPAYYELARRYGEDPAAAYYAQRDAVVEPSSEPSTDPNANIDTAAVADAQPGTTDVQPAVPHPAAANLEVFSAQPPRVVPGQSVRFKGRDDWRVYGTAEDGTIFIGHYGNKSFALNEQQTWNEFYQLNHDIIAADGGQLVPGRAYRVRRSTGLVEGPESNTPWIFEGYNLDGTWRFGSQTAFRERVTQAQLDAQIAVSPLPPLTITGLSPR